jgi:DNA mismatch endonuclease (patch repair protein)
MSRVGPRETKPEKQVRSLLHSLGFRFRKNVRSLPGSPDIVLPKYKTVIFVHGCFWHQHENCRKGRRPTSNTEYWDEKLEANIERDARKLNQLRDLGWKTVVVWQCELSDLPNLELKLREVLKIPA